MTHEFSYDVFLSHSSKDKHIVRPLAERLRNDGLDVWFDEWSIGPGDNIPHKLEEGLEQSRVLVLCMSAHAFGSDWAQLESQTFRFRDPLNKERRFIPLRLDEEAVKDSLTQFAYLWWLPEGNQEYAKLLDACRPIATAINAETPALHNRSPKRVITRAAEDRNIQAYAFTRDGTHALVGGQILQLINIQNGESLTLEGHTSDVLAVSFSANQSTALSASTDRTLRLWDLETGRCIRIFKGHDDEVNVVVWSADQRQALSGSRDTTVRLWEIDTGRCLRVFEGHEGAVWSLAWNHNRNRILSGASDNRVRVWDVDTGECLSVLTGHMSAVFVLSLSSDEKHLLSGSRDHTVHLWELETGLGSRVLEGHEGSVYALEWNANQRHAVSGSYDETVRVWDLESGRCVQVLESHRSPVSTVAWSADQRHVLSGDLDGEIRVWDLSEVITEAPRPKVSLPALPLSTDDIQYTNAKVLLVGESGSGKTGLTERLSQDTFTPSYSTSGTWSTQWPMQDHPAEPGWEREVWLWDFGGQADQRLIHQLYLDKTALVLLVFNADRDAVLPGLREWQQALQRSIPPNTQTFLVAGRTDVGLRFDRQKVAEFAQQTGYQFFETSAQSGAGCDTLRKAIQTGIQWKTLERRTSPLIFKLLKDEILELRDKGNSLVTFKELREILRQRLPANVRFTDGELETVVGLLDGPGVVKEVNFGTYILLRPEWLNIYAQAVIRTLKAARTSLGCLPVQSIAKGELVFQTTQSDGKVVDEKRLQPHEETIVLQAMEQALVERKLCLRQEGQLVFPSYYGLEQPSGPMPPKYFISYTFGGFLDDVYATLIVRLTYCGAFKLKELWRDAADFETLAEKKMMGVKLLRREDGSGELLVHFEKGVAPQEQVIFATYIHDHLKEKASHVLRLRFYVCPNCDTPVKNREIAMQRLEDKGEEAKIICVNCEEYVPLWDGLEKRFASDSVQKRVALLRAQENRELDSRRKGKLLALEVMARITSADQKCFEIPGVEDEGLDIEVEFTDDEGRGTGKRLYLQLKSGNSYLQTRKRDGAEIFKIKKQSWVKYWLKQDCPVLLVIGTFPDEMDERRGGKNRFADIRWMEISELLRRESKNGTQPVRQIIFQGQRLDTLSVRDWRARALGLN
jgi:small GTP-binding protein